MLLAEAADLADTAPGLQTMPANQDSPVSGPRSVLPEFSVVKMPRQSRASSVTGQRSGSSMPTASSWKAGASSW